MMTIQPDGTDRYRLLDRRGRQIGWIRGRAVRFDGFVSEQDVIDASKRAWRALERVLDRGFERETGTEPSTALKLVRDRAYEWISRGRIPIARILRHEADRKKAFAIEILVPPGIPSHLVFVTARAIAEGFDQEPREQALPPPRRTPLDAA